jgi:hypothetical protein
VLGAGNLAITTDLPTKQEYSAYPSEKVTLNSWVYNLAGPMDVAVPEYSPANITGVNSLMWGSIGAATASATPAGVYSSVVVPHWNAASSTQSLRLVFNSDVEGRTFTSDVPFTGGVQCTAQQRFGLTPTTATAAAHDHGSCRHHPCCSTAVVYVTQGNNTYQGCHCTLQPAKTGVQLLCHTFSHLTTAQHGCTRH